MSMRIAGIDFDRVTYDREADVLYLSVGDPSSASSFEESAEGHALRYDQQGRLVGLTIVNARRLLEEDGVVVVTPPKLRVEADELASALAAA
jgi:YD repeat-containing protein